MPDDTCQWFALCERPAAGDAPHPVLGMVPICRPCADRFEIPVIDYPTSDQEN